MSPISGAILIFWKQRKTTVNVARKTVRHVVFQDNLKKNRERQISEHIS